MIGRENVEDDLGADYAPDDFLAGIGSDRPERLHGPQGQEDMGAIARLVRGVRDGRMPRVRCVLAGVAKCVPESVLDWASGKFHDGSVGIERFTPACGPGDTGAVGLERRRELDEEIGWRVIDAIMPVFIVGGFAVYLLAAVYVVLSRPHHTFGGTTHIPSISPRPPATSTSSVLGSIDIAGPAGW